MPVRETRNLPNSLSVFALGDAGCKLRHCTFAFAHDNVVYFWMLQHAVRHVRGMPPSNYDFAGRQHFFNRLSGFNAYRIRRGTAGYSHNLGITLGNHLLDFVKGLSEQVIVKHFHLEAGFFKSGSNIR